MVKTLLLYSNALPSSHLGSPGAQESLIRITNPESWPPAGAAAVGNSLPAPWQTRQALSALHLAEIHSCSIHFVWQHLVLISPAHRATTACTSIFFLPPTCSHFPCLTAKLSYNSNRFLGLSTTWGIHFSPPSVQATWQRSNCSTLIPRSTCKIYQQRNPDLHKALAEIMSFHLLMWRFYYYASE